MMIMLILVLASCGTPPPLTFEQAQATALVAGCWPGNGHTPLPITVTPLGGFVATPDAALPTPTSLPTSTTYPRCTPEPDAPTLMPYPTPGPTRAPFPTRAAFQSTESESAATVLQFSETVLHVDVAVHPTENWPVVTTVTAPFTVKDDPRAVIRVFDPRTRRWRDAISLGSGTSGLARTRFRTAQVGITGDGTIHAVWGVVTTPRLGLMASSSTDRGATWSTPAPIAANTYGVLDLATTADGQVAVLALSEAAQQPLLIQRSSAGIWQPPEMIPVPAWYGSQGALAIVGDGDAARIVAVTTGGGLGSSDNTLFLLSRPLSGGAWQIERRSVPSLTQENASLLINLRAAVLRNGRVLITFAMSGRATGFAIHTTDGGRTWGAIETVFAHAGTMPPFMVAAGDQRSDRALVIRTCCGDATFVSAESTHSLAWGTPGQRDWQPAAFPFVSGAVAAADTAIAQAPGAQVAWLAWVENVHQVQLRALNVPQLAGGGQ